MSKVVWAPGASVAQVVGEAMKGLDAVPRFDPKLLKLDWPDV